MSSALFVLCLSLVFEFSKAKYCYVKKHTHRRTLNYNEPFPRTPIPTCLKQNIYLLPFVRIVYSFSVYNRQTARCCVSNFVAIQAFKTLWRANKHVHVQKRNTRKFCELNQFLLYNAFHSAEEKRVTWIETNGKKLVVFITDLTIVLLRILSNFCKCS